MNGSLWWYVARSSGLVAWAFLIATTVWGALASGRLVRRRGASRWLLALHPFLAGLAVGLVILHLVALVGDSYVHFGRADLLVPFASSWRPGAVAWGVVALWILVAVEATSLARRHLSRRLWRGVHYGSYAVCWAATLHGALAGTDAGRPVVRIGMVAVVGGATAVIVVRALHEPRPARDRATVVRAVPARWPPPRLTD
jgi:hypothetical protein